MASTIHLLDVLIVAAYLALMAGMGVYFSRRQTGLESYFVARGSFGWLPVGLSLMAALNSGLDYLMQPSATIRYGAMLLVGPLSWFFLYPWVARITLPFYRKLNLYTAYEFLEARFDVRVRLLAASIFIVWRLGWMATALYVPCLAINAVFGSQADLTTMIVVIGVVVTTYTMLGGIQAVVWNDVIQFVIMFGGLSATVWISLTHGAGSVAAFVDAVRQAGQDAAAPAAAAAGAGPLDRTVAFFTEPINATAVLVATVVGRMAGFTSDQVMVQRFQTTTNVREARFAFIVNAVSDAVWMIGLSVVGFALLVYFKSHTLPPEYATDKILPYFMAQVFPAGAIGLVIAAILAASLSSIDSAINSSTSVVVVDFYRRLVVGKNDRIDEQAADARQVTVSRIATVAFGLIGTYLATNVARIGGLLEIANKLINAFTGPLFGIYILAMFSRRATSGPVLIAGIVGSVTSYYVAYQTRIGFMWPSTFGLVATLVVGWLMTLVVSTRPTEEALRLTWRQVMNER